MTRLRPSMSASAPVNGAVSAIASVDAVMIALISAAPTAEVLRQRRQQRLRHVEIEEGAEAGQPDRNAPAIEDHGGGLSRARACPPECPTRRRVSSRLRRGHSSPARARRRRRRRMHRVRACRHGPCGSRVGGEEQAAECRPGFACATAAIAARSSGARTPHRRSPSARPRCTRRGLLAEPRIDTWRMTSGV